MRTLTLVIACTCTMFSAAAQVKSYQLPGAAGPQGQTLAIYHDGWIDFNKNGKKDIFEDPTQPVDLRIADLLAQMTIEEKTCQTATLYGFGRVLKDEQPTPEWKQEIWKDGIANIDEDLNGVTNTPSA